MEFKDNLKKARNNKGYSRTELAQKLNISASVISAYENGQRKPSFEVLYNLSDLLEVSVDGLMGRVSGSFKNLDDEVFELAQAMMDNDSLISVAKQIPVTAECRSCVIIQSLCHIILREFS